ncbi:hypothetical protein CRM22_000460, partial [Opisthorchis felineus]
MVTNTLQNWVSPVGSTTQEPSISSAAPKRPGFRSFENNLKQAAQLSKDHVAFCEESGRPATN